MYASGKPEKLITGIINISLDVGYSVTGPKSPSSRPDAGTMVAYPI